MAADGLRAACLTTAGDNEAVDLDALDEKPIRYAISGGRGLDLAFHPVLPLVACLGPSGPILFDRETGKPRPDGVKYPTADLEDATFRRLWFSADGKGLLLDMKDASGKPYLYRAELNLSPAEIDAVGRRLANMASLGRNLLADRAPEPGNGDVPLAEIDAFKGGRGHGDVGPGNWPPIHQLRGGRAERPAIRHRLRRRRVRLHFHLCTLRGQSRRHLRLLPIGQRRRRGNEERAGQSPAHRPGARPGIA